jgi:hypothetical protein
MSASVLGYPHDELVNGPGGAIDPVASIKQVILIL